MQNSIIIKEPNKNERMNFKYREGTKEQLKKKKTTKIMKDIFEKLQRLGQTLQEDLSDHNDIAKY